MANFERKDKKGFSPQKDELKRKEGQYTEHEDKDKQKGFKKSDTIEKQKGGTGI